MLIGYLHGNPYALAGNSRSDDEPNVDSYLGQPINHQWTKTREFEAALQRYGQRVFVVPGGAGVSVMALLLSGVGAAVDASAGSLAHPVMPRPAPLRTRAVRGFWRLFPGVCPQATTES